MIDLASGVVSVFLSLFLLEIGELAVYGRGAKAWTPIRRYVWPKLHEFVSKFGAYSLANVSGKQYVGHTPLSEDELEKVLVEMGFTRNPWAALKRRANTRDISEGSWAYRNAESTVRPDMLASMQLHITLFEVESGGYDIYAHWEDNYYVSPLDHLDETNFSAKKGVTKMRRMLKDNKVSFYPDATPNPEIEQKPDKR